MEKLNLLVLLKLVLAHLVADFVIQTKKWVDDRKASGIKSPYFYLHIAFAAILSYLFVGQWNLWWLVPVVFIVHFLIDTWKIILATESTKFFVLDQLFHFISLVVIYLFITQSQNLFVVNIKSLWNNQTVNLVLFGYVLILWPAGVFIREFTSKWRIQLQFNSSNELDKAGMWIGYLERFLVLTLLLLNQYEVIGFLIAAKSILRLNPAEELKSRQYTEYVLVGTFISLAITISVGLLINFLTSNG